MSNWDLMMPGMGLTAIGLAGVVLSYAEIAHTFIDGLHAMTGLTMFIGLIILAVGILDGGVSTSNRAKATVLTVISIALGFGAYAFTFNTISTSATFAGVLMAIAAPATIIAYIAMKHPKVVKPVATIFVLGSVAGIAAFVGFGLVGPSPYLISEAADAAEEVDAGPNPLGLPEFRIAMLEGSAEQGAPDYEPDDPSVPNDHVVVWVNEDTVAHTATAEGDEPLFDTGLLAAGEEYRFDTSGMESGQYPYLCIVHPWMKSVLEIRGSEQRQTLDISMPEGSGVHEQGKEYYIPSSAEVSVGTVARWVNDDVAAHTVTSLGADGAPDGTYDSGLMGPGDVFEYAYEEQGTFDYFCILHPWMEGTITVS